MGCGVSFCRLPNDKAMWRSIAKVFETADPEDDAPEVAAEAEPASSLEEKAPSLLQRQKKQVPNASCQGHG